jgi:hypothetical protein
MATKTDRSGETGSPGVDAQLEDADGNIPFDVVGFVMAYEGGELDDDEIVKGFQHLIDNGQVWHLQGSYGRQAQRLIDDGWCTLRSDVTAIVAAPAPKPEKVGTVCECGAPYVFLEAHNAWGYRCAR